MTKRGQGIDRDTTGVTITMCRRSGDAPPVTVFQGGFVKVALAKALEPFDPDDWYLGCVSTPRTILADLKGRATQSVSYAVLPGGVRRSHRNALMPEMALLSKVRKLEYAR